MKRLSPIVAIIAAFAVPGVADAKPQDPNCFKIKGRGGGTACTVTIREERNTGQQGHCADGKTVHHSVVFGRTTITYKDGTTVTQDGPATVVYTYCQ